MNRSLPISLAVLQSLVLQGADFTADELRRSIEKIPLLRLDLPEDLPLYPRLSVCVISCRKCGKGMCLDEEPGLMSALTNRLNEKCGGKHYRFILDESSLCPHCGDGRFYLEIQREMLDWPPGKIEWKKFRRIPVNRADLLFLLSGWYCCSRTLQNGEWLGRSLQHIFENDSFLVKSEEDFLSFAARVVPRVADAQKKKIEEEKKEAAEIFQKLTSSAHVMRREDLDAYLEKTAKLSDRNYDYRTSHFAMFTRMAIFADSFLRAWAPLTCPACARRYYVCNGSNSPIIIQPLGDLLEAMKKIDISPDFSSLCPYCHPGEQDRKLTVSIHAEGQKDLSAGLTPGDLALLADFVFFQNRPHPFENRYPSLPAVTLMRLKEILLGEKGDARISARPLPADEK